MSETRALVTGGGGALGAAICRALAQDGRAVIVHGSGANQGPEKVVREIQGDGGQARSVYFDLSDPTATARGLEDLLEGGAVQVIVHNAGIHDDAPLAGMNARQWRRVLAVSLDGFFHVTQPLLLPMLRTRWGRIISVSSLSAVMGNRGQVNYAAAKAGLHGATKSLAKECASRGVTVNAVAPGIIETPETIAAFGPEKIAGLVPMKRSGTPEEVAELVRFLASDRAAYITGQIISIDGGIT